MDEIDVDKLKSDLTGLSKLSNVADKILLKILNMIDKTVKKD